MGHTLLVLISAIGLLMGDAARAQTQADVWLTGQWFKPSQQLSDAKPLIIGGYKASIKTRPGSMKPRPASTAPTRPRDNMPNQTHSS